MIVGPGFKEKFGAAYPTIADSPVASSAWKDRNLREIDFDTESKGLMLGPFRALDLYGDGSVSKKLSIRMQVRWMLTSCLSST